MRRNLSRIAPFALLLASACTVGPDYAGPPHATTAGALPANFVRGSNVTPEAPAVAHWWTTLNDPVLDRLEQRALAGNPTLAVADARVKQARAGVRLERANGLPSASATVAYAHAELPPLGMGGDDSRSSLNLYDVGFDASWEVDLFGGHRRSVEAARASFSAAEANSADARVQLTAEVAQAYVNLRDRQTRLELLRKSANTQQQMLDLTRQRYERGAASALDVERLRGQVETTRSQQVPLAAEAEIYKNALAVLVGEAPGALDADLATVRAAPLPPASVPIGDPAELLQRRPDIRAAERQLAAKTAQIGVAEAARFPRLSFMGLVGLGGTSFSDVTNINEIAAIAMPQLSWSFLDFGRTLARVHQAEAARDEAEAQYRATVLSALQDAEDSLARFGHRREAAVVAARIKASADRAAMLTEQRYRAGTATLIDLLDTERQQLAAEQNLAETTAALTGDYVALQKSLGLGWEAGPASGNAP